MIEVLTVTTTPTSLRDLIETARSITLPDLVSVRQLIMKVAQDVTDIVYLEDPDTVTPVRALDPAESEWSVAFPVRKLDDVILSSGAGDVEVEIIIGQSTI